MLGPVACSSALLISLVPLNGTSLAFVVINTLNF